MKASVPAPKALVLFAHGARDPRWAEPFERVRAQVASRLPDLRVALAYLELMQPSLESVVEMLAAEGCDGVTVAPLFLGQGSHLRRDLPERVAALRARFASLLIVVGDAAGDDDAVVDALAAYCVRLAG